MKQLQITVPEGSKDKAEEVLEKYSSDISSSEAEKNGEKVVEFRITAESNQIDELTEEMKSIDSMESGDLTIRVMKQESLIRKGQKTKGSSSMLSQAEIYSEAQESAVFNRAEWSLVALSAGIASYGLISENIVVVIGAMMVAPILSPFISSALSVSVGDRSLLTKSLKTGVLSVFLGIIISAFSLLPFQPSINSTVALVATPSLLSVLLSLLVGAAASLTFVTGMKDEMAGVAVAIALIPPIASVGIGIRTLSPKLMVNALTVVLSNTISIVAAGFVCFRMLKIKPETYYRKKQAEKMRYILPISIMLLLGISVFLAVSGGTI